MQQVFKIGYIEKGKVIKASEFKYELGTIIYDGRMIVDRYYYKFINRDGRECNGYYYKFDFGLDLNEDLI